MSEFKVGDTVKVEFEAVVDIDSAYPSDELRLELPDGTYRWIHSDYMTKVEPPVVTFAPGTKVRSKRFKFEYTIGVDGFFNHCTFNYVQGDISQFTSEFYEVVE